MRRTALALACGLAIAAAGIVAWRYVARPADPSPARPPAGAAALKSGLRTSVPSQPSAAAGPAQTPCPIRFREVTDHSGIAFQHTDGGGGHEGAHYIVEAMSAGLATFDYDGDSLIDVYFPNGAPLPGSKFDRPPRHALYKNLGGWRFREVTDEAGVACTAYGLGIAVVDYDNDGRPDVYLDNFGPNLLYRNQGNGSFRDVTQQAGVPGTTPSGVLARKVGAGACFLDIDRDGNLDLYVGNYIELDLSAHVTRRKQGIPFYPTPLDYTAIPDTVYRNRGDGTFEDASHASAVAAHSGRSMGMTAGDYDDDGLPDVFVCNDVQENFLFRNTGGGKFEQVGLFAGVAMSPNAEMVANMAVDCGDFDNDGRLDFFTTNYQDQFPMLFRNLGEGMFENVTLTAGAGAGCYPFVNWGCGMVDFDNDGHKDIFVGQGHTEDNIERIDRTTAYRTHNVLLWNTGKGKFINVSQECGLKSVPVHAARGIAFDDFDNDGDIDVAVLNIRERPMLLRNVHNEQRPGNHWLQIQLRGVKTNRDGVGARVKMVAGDLVLLDEVHSGRGYQSHWGARLHFGLGKRDRIERIEIRWTGGGTDVLENIAADRLMTITEGTSR